MRIRQKQIEFVDGSNHLCISSRRWDSKHADPEELVIKIVIFGSPIQIWGSNLARNVAGFCKVNLARAEGTRGLLAILWWADKDPRFSIFVYKIWLGSQKWRHSHFLLFRFSKRTKLCSENLLNLHGLTWTFGDLKIFADRISPLKHL